jgi:hypothetical protein
LSPRPHMGQRVGRLQRRDDAFEPGAAAGRLQRLLVHDRHIFDPAGCPSARNAPARCPDSRDRPRSSGLPGSGRRRPAAGRCGCRAARPAPAGQRGAMLRSPSSPGRRPRRRSSHVLVVKEGMEQADGVGAAADAGHQHIRQAAFPLRICSRVPCRSPTGSRAPSPDRDAARPPCRSGSRCLSTLVTQSRSASFIASFSVPCAGGHRTILAPSSFMRNTFGACRSTSVSPM